MNHNHFHCPPRLAVLAVVLGTALAAQAAGGEPSVVGAFSAQRGLSTTATLKLQKTVIDSGLAGLQLPPATYTPVGTPVKLNCTVAAGCVIAATLELQITQVGNNAPALCFFLDSQKVTCPYDDKLSATSGYKMLSHHSSAAVAFGEHLVEMRVYTEAQAAANYYQAEYRLFK